MIQRNMLFGSIALALLGLAGALVFTARDAKARPLVTALSEGMPLNAGDWSVDGVPPESAVARDSAAGDSLLRTYRRGPETIWVAVDYYPYQGEGRRAAARELVLPGRGWATLGEQAVTISVPGLGQGVINATLIDLSSKEWRLALVYWYQLPGRTTASDHEYRALLFYNRLRYRRADATLVRIAIPIRSQGDARNAVSTELHFVHAFYGQLLAALER